MSHEDDKALVPVDQRDIDFYGDVITAVITHDGMVYIPIRPICQNLGVSWPSQSNRISRDPILSEVKGVFMVNTPGGQQQAVCLPLDYLNGWLFKMDASRVRPDIKEPLLRYQRECYRILADAFIGQNTAVQPAGDSDEPLVQLHNMALVIAATTREMLATKYLAQSNAERLDRAALVVQNLTRRVTAVEQQVRAGKLTEEQAAEIKRRVNLIANEMSKHDPGKTHFQAVYAALGDEVGVTSYKAIPLKAYETAVSFLDNWLLSLKQAGKKGAAEAEG
jgi:hypothetical protein